MISIIIIAKNEEKVLPRLLKSIKRQDFPYEIILSDAKSTDKTREIAKKYGCRIVNGGLPSKGRNAGARVSKYEHLLFLDSDVVLPRGFLKKVMGAFDMGVECGTGYYIPMTGDRSIKAMYRLYNSYAKIMQNLVPHAGGFCIFCTKKIFKKINGFDETRLLAEDHDFVRRAAEIAHFEIVPDIKIYCDIRRIEKEGKVRLAAKYIRGGIYEIFFRDSRKPAFDYYLHGCDESVKDLYGKT